MNPSNTALPNTCATREAVSKKWGSVTFCCLYIKTKRRFNKHVESYKTFSYYFQGYYFNIKLEIYGSLTLPVTRVIARIKIIILHSKRYK